jgi:hypothetical protein
VLFDLILRESNIFLRMIYNFVHTHARTLSCAKKKLKYSPFSQRAHIQRRSVCVSNAERILSEVVRRQMLKLLYCHIAISYREGISLTLLMVSLNRPINVTFLIRLSSLLLHKKSDIHIRGRRNSLQKF